jgi:spermidine dehydrogenase
MDRSVTRRDFLNGFALAIGGAAIPPELYHLLYADTDPENSAHYYPPSKTGLRGSHKGSFEDAHSLRDGTFWKSAGALHETGEEYDLAVVGGGISGLAAAHYFRKAAGPRARILILENHDDFGGHAKRNEFQTSGRPLIGYGGTFSIESPAPYSAVAKGLIRELGIDVASFPKFLDMRAFTSLGLRTSVFFDRETFGEDKLVAYSDEPSDEPDTEVPFRKGPSDTFLASAPLSENARRDIARIHHDKKDYLAGLTSAEKKARLARISYADFLTKTAGLDPGVLPYFQAFSHPLFGMGIDGVSAQDARGIGLPGFEGMNLDSSPGPGVNRDAVPNEEAEAYFFHFPDGCATIARLLVRQLVPQAIPGGNVEDSMTAPADYGKLDQPSSPVRIRLNSTAVRVRHLGDPSTATETEISYARHGRVYSVRASHCILACWHIMIPYLCPELPQRQKEALKSAAKVPIVYTSVALRDWKIFQKLRIRDIYAPGGYYSFLNLDLPVNIGSYQSSRTPAEPIIFRMMRTPCQPGQPARQQHLLGRIELFATDFETFERKTRDQLARSLSSGGFDPARDITAVTVNRWPHGYAYQYNSLWDKFWLEGGEQPCQVARKPFGRIAIANADADAYSYADCAIDQAYRAVQEVISNHSRERM